MAGAPYLVLVLIISILGVPGQPGRRLNDYVHHYEPLSYDAVDHLRVKRSTVDGDDDGVRLNFASHGRQFNLRLKRDLSVFPDNIRIEDREGRRLQHLVRIVKPLYSCKPCL